MPRSDGANIRSTTSGPGRCRRSLEIFGDLKPSRYSALPPRWCSMAVSVGVTVFPFLPLLNGRGSGMPILSRDRQEAVAHLFNKLLCLMIEDAPQCCRRATAVFRSPGG